MNTIMFHSYKGGSGKTLFSINVAHILAKLYDKRVLLIESDFVMPSFQGIFSEYAPDVFFNDYLAQDSSDLMPYIYPNQTENLGFIFCNEKFQARDNVHTGSEGWFLQKMKQLFQGIKELDYDYYIFDISPGLHMFTINVLAITRSIFVVMRPNTYSYRGVNLLLNDIYSKSINLAGQKLFDFQLIFNQIPKLDKIVPYLSEWKLKFQKNYDFIDRIHEFYYEPDTSYYAAINQVVLPSTNETSILIDRFVNDSIFKRKE